jgi:hypothetical protein
MEDFEVDKLVNNVRNYHNCVVVSIVLTECICMRLVLLHSNK